MKTSLKFLLALSILLLGLSFSQSFAECCEELEPVTPSALAERSQVFTDISIEDEDYWFTTWTHEEEIFKGYPDGSFGKDNKIKRAELMVVVVRMMGIEPKLEDYDHCFPDVTSNNSDDIWFVPSVCYAADQGWVNGYQNGYFGPADSTTVVQSLKIVLNPLFKEEIESQRFFEDYQEGPGWFQPYLSFAEEGQLMLPISYYKDGIAIGEANRVSVAGLIFRAILMKEEGWDKYYDYLANNLFAQRESGQLLSNDYPCYQPDSDIPLPEFMVDYVQQEYGIDYFIERWRDWDDPEEFPFFDVNGFCHLKTGGLVLIGGSKTKEGTLQRHRVEFDASEQVVEDQSLVCSNEVNVLQKGVLYPVAMNYIEPNTFEFLDCFYSKDERTVYLGGDFHLDFVQPNDFQQLTFPYSTDGIRVYHRDLPMEGVDPNDFTPLTPKNSPIEYAPYALANDQIYAGRHLMEGVDVESFEVIDVPDLPLDYLGKGDHYSVLSYAKDKNTVYTGPYPLDYLDPESFEIVDYMYGKDKNAVYMASDLVPIESIPVEGRGTWDVYHTRYYLLLEEADPETFESLYSYFSRDKDAVYAEGRRLEGVSPQTVSLLKGAPNPFDWLKTDQGIYLRDEPLTQISDPDTFIFIDENYAKDSKNVFYLKKSGGYGPFTADEVVLVQGADPDTFEKMKDQQELDSNIYRDAGSIFYEGKRVDTAALDLNTAKLTNERVLVDDNGLVCHVQDWSVETSCQLDAVRELFTNEEYNYNLSVLKTDSIGSNQYATEPEQAFNVSLYDESEDFLLNIQVLDPELHPQDSEFHHNIVRAYNLPLKEYVEHLVELNKDHLDLGIQETSAGGASGYTIAIRDQFTDDTGGYLFGGDYPVHTFVFVEHNGFKYQFEFPESLGHRGEMILESLKFE